MQFLKPHVVIQHFDIEPGMHVAELHKGSGFFTAHLAEQVGPYGKVHRFEEDIFNDEHASLPETVDRLLLANILFAAPEKRILFSHAYRNLKPGGKLIVIEMHDESPLATSMHELVSEAGAMHLAGMAGFAHEKRFNAGEHHYGLIFRKI